MDQQNHIIVLIHGFGFDSDIWAPVEPAFEKCSVIRLSLPGFGEDRLAGSYTIPELASFYWRELDPQENDVYHLAGHSMGGYVVMEMAAQQMARVGSIALIHSHVFADPADKKKKRDESIAAIERDGHEAFASKMIGGMVGSEYKPNAGALLDRLIERGTGRTAEAWKNGLAAMRDRRDHEATLTSLPVPVLMIMGEDDAAIPLELVYRQAAIAERCDLIVLPGVGHLSMFEKTDEVKNLMARFYNDVIG